VRAAIDLLQRARGLAERAEFSDLDRADVLFRLAVCRYKLSSTSTAIALFDEALELAERSGLPCDLLRSDILQRRSRCHRRLRDYVAAHDDIERALELAQDLGDRAAIANAYFQASLVSQRQGHYVLSRSYAQRAKELYQQLNDERNVGRLLLMLGGLTLLLGDEEHAVEHLKASYSRALDADSPADAAQALEGIARVHLNRGEYDQADELARKALTPMLRDGDFRVRRALHLAADRQQMIDSLFQGYGRIQGPISAVLERWALPEDELASLPGYRSGRSEREGDIREARQMFSEISMAAYLRQR